MPCGTGKKVVEVDGKRSAPLSSSRAYALANYLKGRGVKAVVRDAPK